MGLNLPLLLANHPPLDTWHPSGPFSPPQDRNHQLHVSLPMAFSTPSSDLNNSASGSLGGAGVRTGSGNGGAHSIFGGSSNSDFAGSPQKPMDTTDIENEKEIDTKCERTTSTPSNIHDTSVASNEGRLSSGPNGTPGDASDGGGGGGGGRGSGGGSIGGGSGGGSGGGVVGGRLSAGGASGTDAGSSPIPNTNTFEAHKQRHLIAGGTMTSGSRGDQSELDIKQELLENYFHAPHPPPPPDSHRSYSSAEDNRHAPECPDDFAQDLRVSAAAAAAAKGIDFTRFVLPPSLRRSSESIDEKFSPLNMRKLTASSASSSAAGQMLMNSLLSNESMSEDNNTSISERLKSASAGGNPNGISNSQDASSSAAAAAAAAALYAESLNKDDCDFIGSNVSVKLRSMDRTQRIIAEKLISEVLYYGQFNELERSARIQPK